MPVQSQAPQANPGHGDAEFLKDQRPVVLHPPKLETIKTKIKSFLC
jgi:hypothetical protein